MNSFGDAALSSFTFGLKERKEADIWEFRWYEPNGRLRSKLLGTVEPDAKLLSSAEVGLGTERRGGRHFVAVLYRYAKTKDVSAGFRLENFSMA